MTGLEPVKKEVAGARTLFVRSHVGHIRSVNEDACSVSPVHGQVDAWRGRLSEGGGWALLADGLSGQAAGQVASALALAIVRPLMGGVRTERAVQALIRTADTALYLAMDQEPELRGMGTTIAGAVILSDEVLLFNVGDSRIYLHEAGKLSQVSIDDVVEGDLLTQCLGGAPSQGRLKPHITRRPLPPRMAILLCSDGLTGMLTDSQIALVLADYPSDPAGALVSAALAVGGHDNVSAIFIAPALGAA